MMSYLNKFVATIKVGGKILREQSETVALPFGSEYSILLKNQNSVRALVRVSIDGNPLSDVADGWVIIGANDTLELERFIRNGNFNKGNRLKFIERTGAVEEHRGIGVDDGLVRVEFKFEKRVVQQNYYPLQQVTWGAMNCNTTPSYTITTTPTALGGDFYRSSSPSSKSSSPSSKSSSPSSNVLRSASVNMMAMKETSLNDAGVTVAGSESNQQFSWGSWFPTEDHTDVIMLRLVGRSGEAAVAKPVTVREKPTCTSCGKVNKATHKFCGRCGTALQLF